MTSPQRNNNVPTEKAQLPPLGIDDIREVEYIPQVGRIDDAYDPRPVEDRTRSRIAIALVVLVALVVIFAFVGFWSACPSSGVSLKDLLTILFGPIIALTSGALGYYFGGNKP